MNRGFAMQLDSSSFRHLANDLARCLYSMRLQETILDNAMRHPDDDPDLSTTARMLSKQCIDLAVLQRDKLIAVINQYLTDTLRADYCLTVNKSEKWRVDLSGGTIDFTVKPFGFGTLEQCLCEKNTLPTIFICQLDYGDMLALHNKEPADLSISGEFWEIDGNVQIGSALWPFVIDLDGSCFRLKTWQDNIQLCECSEK